VWSDGVRVLNRLIQQAKPLIHSALAGVRDAFRRRVRSARRVLQHIHRGRRQQGEDATAQQRGLYARLLELTRQTVRQAQRVRAALEGWQPHAPDDTAPQAASAQERAVERLQARFDRFLPLVQQGMPQAQARVLDGQPVASQEKVLSLFEPHTRVVKRGKLNAAVEFGRQVVLDEVDGGIVTRFHVLADDESECHQAVPAIQHHHTVFGRAPGLVTGDRRLHTQGIEPTAQGWGVTQVVIPRIGRLTAAQRAREQQRSWRAGIEGRIHSLRRDDGLARCRSHGLVGLERDVGWGGGAGQRSAPSRRRAGATRPAGYPAGRVSRGRPWETRGKIRRSLAASPDAS
jgi:IS5 family transposase